jgi:hypothetical protein
LIEQIDIDVTELPGEIRQGAPDPPRYLQVSGADRTV